MPSGDAMRQGSEAGKCPLCKLEPKVDFFDTTCYCTNEDCELVGVIYTLKGWELLPRYTAADLTAARLSGARKCKEAVLEFAMGKDWDHCIERGRVEGIDLAKLLEPK